MSRRYLYLPFVFFLFASCENTPKENVITQGKKTDNLMEKEKAFVIPTINVVKIEGNDMFYEKYEPFTKSLLVGSNLERIDSFFYVYDTYFDSLKLFPTEYHQIEEVIVDTSTTFEFLEFIHDISKLDVGEPFGSRATDSVTRDVYPLYLVNNSDEVTRYSIQDGMIPHVVQALDSLGKWRDIEKWEWSWCGNSYTYYHLKPDHYSLTGVYKYDGEFKTKFRVKMYLDEKELYSNIYSGSLNYDLFHVIDQMGE